MSERTLNRHFQQQTGLRFAEWVRRARLMEALLRLAQGQPVRVALTWIRQPQRVYGDVSPGDGISPSDYFKDD